jgi:hypothetical protein
MDSQQNNRTKSAQKPDNSYYWDQMKKLAELAVQSSEKQETFWQHVLLVFSGTFGIVVSLHSDNSPDLHIRLVFALAVVLLSLGTLCSAIVVYDHSQLVERARLEFSTEVQKALREHRAVKPVYTNMRKRTLFCKLLSCVFLVCSILSLASYSVLYAFSGQ